MSLKKLILPLIIFSIYTKNSVSQTWIQLQDFAGTQRDDGTSFTIYNKAYCGTGLQVGWSTTRDFYSFDFDTESWSSIASLPVGKERQYATAFSFNGFGYVCGGTNTNALNDMWMYNPTDNSWIEKTSKPGMGLSGSTSFVIDSIAYIIGGNNSNTQASNEVWSYNLQADEWQQKTNFPYGGRWRSCGATLNSKGYLLFGKDNNGNYDNKLYEYNSDLDTWSIISEFPNIGRTYSSLNSVQSNLVVFGGLDSNNFYYNDLWYFQLADSSWHQQNSLSSFGRKGGMSFSSYSTFYYATGIDAQNNRLKETWKVENPTNIDDLKTLSNINIYPNPAKDIINIRLDGKEGYNLSIYNTYGQQIINLINYKSNIINIDKLESGIYYLKLDSDRFTKKTKFIKL